MNATTQPAAAKKAMCFTSVRMYRHAVLTLPNTPQLIKKTIPSMQAM
jgi:hypothetical protein